MGCANTGAVRRNSYRQSAPLTHTCDGGSKSDAKAKIRQATNCVALNPEGNHSNGERADQSQRSRAVMEWAALWLQLSHMRLGSFFSGGLPTLHGSLLYDTNGPRARNAPPDSIR